jgi:hypothetical protein
MKTKKMTASQSRNSINRSPLRCGFLLVPLAVACFALSPAAQAVSPAPDGGYANGNTAEGDSALLNLTTGRDNAAVGFEALFNNTTGSSNTAIGGDALFTNNTGSQNTANGTNALFSNTTGSANTASGVSALQKTPPASTTRPVWRVRRPRFGSGR